MPVIRETTGRRARSSQTAAKPRHVRRSTSPRRARPRRATSTSPAIAWCRSARTTSSCRSTATPAADRGAEPRRCCCRCSAARRASGSQQRGYVDLAIDAPGGGRLRANISRQQAASRARSGSRSHRPRTLEELGLPKELAKVVSHHQGLVVIAGPERPRQDHDARRARRSRQLDASRTTSSRSRIRSRSSTRARSRWSRSARSGATRRAFATALKASLREDPDVIVIGELRDRETVEIALTAAETGHLVLATMSTPSAAKTIDRLIDMFPPDDQQQVRASLAGALRAIVAQRLLPARSAAAWCRRSSSSPACCRSPC